MALKGSPVRLAIERRAQGRGSASRVNGKAKQRRWRQLLQQHSMCKLDQDGECTCSHGKKSALVERPAAVLESAHVVG